MKLNNAHVIEKFILDWSSNEDGSHRNFNIKDGVIENWNDADREKPIDAEIQSWHDGLSNYWSSLNVQLQRKITYPPIADQLDMQYHDQLNGTTTWKDAIAKVKSDNPKA